MAFQVVLTVVVVLAVMVMLNYLSHDHHLRLHSSSRTKIVLSSRTKVFLHSLTNDIKTVVYFDKNEPLYKDVADLLNEYQLANGRISVRTAE